LNAEIICVGTELLLGQIVDTNSTKLSQYLASLGVNVFHKSTVGDNLQRIVESLRLAASRADLVIACGGLGPTQDDLTKEAISAAFDVPMVEDPESVEHIRSFFQRRRIPIAASNLKQALLFEGGNALRNDFGTAPGAVLEIDGRTIACLPGPPRELIPMVENQLLPYLRERHGLKRVLRSRVLRLAGMGESAAEERVKDLLGGSNPTVAPLLSGFEVTFRITGTGEDEGAVEAGILEAEKRLRQRLGKEIYGADDDTLESVVLGHLRDRGLSLVTAESCTGGLIAHRLTNVAGSSDTFLSSVVCYANAAKESLLGVRRVTLEGFGAVSWETAREMAEGAMRELGGDAAIAVTGIAGPGGGSDEKPVGLVYIATALPSALKVQEYHFAGTRLDVKQRTAQAALEQMRRAILHL
jgi:nicotinamide-nucleotide amidase